MNRWVIILCLLILAVQVPQVWAYSIAGTVTGGQSNLLMVKYVVAVPMVMDSGASLLQNITAANPFNSYRYRFANLDSGSYFIISFQDIHMTLPPVPQLDDPRGFYGANGLPEIMDLQSDTANINLVLNPPNSGGFTGRISYAGTQRAITYVQAYYTAQFDTLGGVGVIIDTIQTGNGDYTALTDTFRTYYAYAFMDVNGNFQHDADEPYGIYGNAMPTAIHVQQTNFPDSINIVMHDPQSAVEPSHSLPADARLSSIYPNPFNNSSTVAFTVSTSEEIELALYDVLGRQVAILAHGSFSPGEHRLTLSGDGLSTGLYFVRLTGSHSTESRAAILLK